MSTALCLNWLLKIKFVSEFEALFSVEEKQCGVLTCNCDLSEKNSHKKLFQKQSQCSSLLGGEKRRSGKYVKLSV